MTRRIFCKVLLVAVAVFVLLALSSVLLAQGRSEEAFERVREVQERHTEKLMSKPGVVGTAVGLNDNGRHVVMVLLEKPGVPGIPDQLEGVFVRQVVTGKIYALVDPTARFPRPVPTGVSTGHPKVTAGTIACRVTDGTNVYALSNNHVYANSNEATIGDPILQPGTVDGGGTDPDRDDVIGNLSEFEPIVFSRWARNEIDAAIASSTTSLLGNATPSPSDGGYGTPNSTDIGAFLGQQVQKYGRTTQLTQGVITGVNVTIRVGYGPGKTARFVKQIIVESWTRFIGGGDSGSLLVTNDTDCNPVGLLFAGNSAGTMAVANRIDLVLERFGVTVDGAEAPTPPPPAPVAAFSGSPTSGNAPLTVNFTDQSTGSITSWSWTFGDEGTSADQNPSHRYQDPGDYTVSLTVTGPGGSHTETKTDYITVGTTPEEATVSVASITYATRGGKDGKKHLLIDVVLVDDLDAPVEGASVSILLTKIDPFPFQTWIGTETTGTDGTAAFRLSNAPSGLYTTLVTNVTDAGLPWDGITPPNIFTK